MKPTAALPTPSPTPPQRASADPVVQALIDLRSILEQALRLVDALAEAVAGTGGQP